VKLGSLFSGIGGLELGLERAGLGHTIWQIEKDPEARRVLAHHWPNVTRYEDVNTVGVLLERPDLLCGGFPCQDISKANQSGRGLAGARSGLWYQFERLADELRPEWIVVENVYHAWRQWVPAVRRALWRLGYSSVCLRVRASDVGARHKRARGFVVANADGRILREQSGRSGWAERQRQAVVATVAADADVPRQQIRHGQRSDAQPQPQPWTDARSADLGALGERVHGLSNVVAIRLLGNAVVPQCAEVVGRIIRGLVMPTYNISLESVTR